MFDYHLDLALGSLKSSKVLTALVVLAIALGISAPARSLRADRALAQPMIFRR